MSLPGAHQSLPARFIEIKGISVKRKSQGRIHTHGWGQCERQLGIQRHQQRGNGSREDGGGEQGIGIHARLTEQRGMDCQYISHLFRNATQR